MKFSKNFTLQEFTRSQTATCKGIDNVPSIHVSSGYCSQKKPNGSEFND